MISVVVDRRGHGSLADGDTVMKSKPKEYAIPTNIKWMPEEAFQNLCKWHGRALQHEKSGLPADQPDHGLLLSVLPRMATQGTLEGTPHGPAIRETFYKPKKEGTTQRLYDPAAVFVFGTHLVAGGGRGLALRAFGSKDHYYYYPRLYLPGRNHSVYGIRLIVNAKVGRLTREYREDFHDHCRSALGGIMRQTDPRQPAAFIGRELAAGWTLDAVREAMARGDTPPAGLTEALIRQMLADGYRFLDAIPLGEAGEPA